MWENKTMQIPNFKYFYNNKSEILDVILHGGSQGMDSSLICKVVDASRGIGNSVAALNFPYIERGEDHSSGPELIEEIEALKQVLNFCHFENFKHIRLIGKSLGGIVVAAYLSRLSPNDQEKYSAYILGYDLGVRDIRNFNGAIRIVQGEKDKFGNVETVKKDMDGALSKNITYLEIPNADHSYRDPETKEPVFEDEAVKALFT